jgi:SAM-dependent methyltransferase
MSVRTWCEVGCWLGCTPWSVFAEDALTVVVGAFEDWEPSETFDAVMAFTSWHWVDPTVRAAKIAEVLRPPGVLATITTTHIRVPATNSLAASSAATNSGTRP